jgi:hypothetical protein
MKLVSAILVLSGALAAGQDPVVSSWMLNPSAKVSHQAILPEVHSVEAGQHEVVVRSAGLTLQPFGPIEANEYTAPAGVRKLEFHIPRQPRAATDRIAIDQGQIGALVNGMPLYNPASPVSYRNQNLWHFDAVARSQASSPLLSLLIGRSEVHSPILGYALDGFPIYGPYGFDSDGKVARMKSSYRQRRIKQRDSWTDGTVLMTSQAGPVVDPTHPIGAFVEDYEYVEGLGDLDQSNARYAVTPEYPRGTWAYFLTIDDQQHLAYPYTVGPQYRGSIATASTASTSPQAGQPHRLYFDPRLKSGKQPRYLEKVHEKPLHLLIVSEDLSDYAHIHPMPAAGGGFAVEHTFPFGGRFHIYADYALPGEGPKVDHQWIQVAGGKRDAIPLQSDLSDKQLSGIRFRLALDAPPRTGTDIGLSLTLKDASTGQPIADLEPYLGAWAHFVLVSVDGQEFIHAHPLDGAVESEVHDHSTVAGPNPPVLRTLTGFRKPGIYKLWAQVQRKGQVLTVPFVLEVTPGLPVVPQTAAPSGSTQILVTSRGYEPSSIQVTSGQLVKLAFLRTDAQNCGGTIVIPELKISRQLTVGKLELVEFVAPAEGTLTLTCGMGMYRGAVLVKTLP